MDEPFGAVDPLVRVHLQDFFLDLQKTLHKTVVMVTHDIDEAVKMGDRVAVFNTHGELAHLPGQPLSLRSQAMISWPISSAVPEGYAAWRSRRSTQSGCCR
ncbi:MAG: hypothetical protein R2693_01970 [Nocardioidaceae bacterium]